MKYASEILGLMRPYPGREFRMSQIVRAASGGRDLTDRQREAVRKGARRVLSELIESGQVVRLGENPRTMTYQWCGLGHEVRKKPCTMGRQLGQYR